MGIFLDIPRRVRKHVQCEGVDTCSKWLTHSRKCVYMNHRRFLAHNHPFRGKAGWFDGTIECGRKPRTLISSEVLKVVKNLNNDWGKAKKKIKKKRKRETDKDSI